MSTKKSLRQFTQNDLDDALFACMETGNATAVQLVIDAGADVNAFRSWKAQSTPLHAAAAKGSVKLCQILIENGANIEAKSSAGYTPLYIALLNGDTARKTGFWLIAHGAKTNNVGGLSHKGLSFSGMGMHEAAIRSENIERLQELIEKEKMAGGEDEMDKLISLAKSLKKKEVAAVLQSMAARLAVESVVPPKNTPAL